MSQLTLRSSVPEETGRLEPGKQVGLVRITSAVMKHLTNTTPEGKGLDYTSTA